MWPGVSYSQRPLASSMSPETPSSFAREVYNGVDTFVFVAKDGTKTPFRYKIAPEGGAALGRA